MDRWKTAKFLLEPKKKLSISYGPHRESGKAIQTIYESCKAQSQSGEILVDMAVIPCGFLHVSFLFEL